MKKNYKKIIMILLMLVVSSIALNNVNAAVTDIDVWGNANLTVELGFVESAIEGLSDILNFIGSSALTGVGAFITPLINGLTIIILNNKA